MSVSLGAHKDPIELVARARAKEGLALAWACGECGQVCVAGDTDGGKLAERTAREHCAERFCECGKKLPRYWNKCGECGQRDQSKTELATEEKAYEAAVKIPWQEYDGLHVQSPRTNEYYPDVDVMLDSEDDPLDDLPSWAWACNAVHLKFNARSVILDQLEADEHHEDSMSSVSDKEVAALQEMLDLWSVNITVESFFPDYTRVVTFDDLVRQRATDLGDEDEVSEGK